MLANARNEDVTRETITDESAFAEGSNPAVPIACKSKVHSEICTVDLLLCLTPSGSAP